MTAPTVLADPLPDRYLLTAPKVWDGQRLLPDSGLLVEGGSITWLGPTSEAPGTSAAWFALDGEVLLAPGLVNAHQHGRSLQTTQTGVADAPLEEWLVAQLGIGPVDPYAETRQVARKLLAEGVTATLHVHGTGAATQEQLAGELRAVLRAYADEHVRASVAVEVRDRGVPVYGDGFCESLPADLRARTGAAGLALPATAVLEVLADLHAEVRQGRYPGVQLMLGPPGQPWCSLGLMGQVAATAAELGIGVHTHLLETVTERAFGLLDHPGGSVAFLRAAGLLEVPLSLAHGVWLDRHDLEQLAAAGSSVVTNPSSNLRLAAGIAPLEAIRNVGVPLGLGTDNLALDGSEGLLGEARLARALQSAVDAEPPQVEQVLGMMTAAGARAMNRVDVGRLGVGAAADLAVLSCPGTAVDVPDSPELVLAHGRPAATVVGGRLVAVEGRHVGAPLPDSRYERDGDLQRLAAELLPRARAHYARMRADAGNLS